MISERAKREAQKRFEIRFKRAVLERIERERDQKFSKPAIVLNEERDALVLKLAAEGASVGAIAIATRMKGCAIRALLGMPPAPQSPRRRVRAATEAR